MLRQRQLVNRPETVTRATFIPHTHTHAHTHNVPAGTPYRHAYTTKRPGKADIKNKAGKATAPKPAQIEKEKVAFNLIAYTWVGY